MADSAGAAPYRRAVFYVAGFDIVGPRFYEALFKRGLKQDSALEPRRYRLTELAAEAPAARHWRIDTQDRGRAVEVAYHLLTPNAIAGAALKRGTLSILTAWAQMTWAYVRYAVLFRGLRICWKAGASVLYVLLVPPAFIALGGAIAAGLARIATPDWPWIAGAALAGAALGLRAGLRLNRRANFALLLSSMTLAYRHLTGRAPAIGAAIADFARYAIGQSERFGADEILIVAHSSGSVFGAEIVAALLDRPGLAARRTLSYLTLGSNDGIAALFPQAARYRAAVAKIAASERVDWVEYHAAWDAICMGPRDPIAAYRIDLGGKARRGPAIRRLYFTDFFSAERRKTMRIDFFARHFDYLRAGDRKSAYSYFRILCAAAPLRETTAREKPDGA